MNKQYKPVLFDLLLALSCPAMNQLMNKFLSENSGEAKGQCDKTRMRLRNEM